jgi:TetR/AcrR family transcriptional regulator, transcriptional repressor for nem operon
MPMIIDWAEAQFQELGCGRQSRELAVDLLAAYEGSALLANTLRDPKVLSEASRRIERWIDAQ